MNLNFQIINSLRWLSIDYDGKEYVQSKNISKHVSVQKNLLKKVLRTNVIVQRTEINEQKKNVKNKVFHMFITENGETLKI